MMEMRVKKRKRMKKKQNHRNPRRKYVLSIPCAKQLVVVLQTRCKSRKMDVFIQFELVIFSVKVLCNLMK